MLAVRLFFFLQNTASQTKHVCRLSGYVCRHVPHRPASSSVAHTRSAPASKHAARLRSAVTQTCSPPRGQRGWMWQKPGCPQALPPNLSVLHIHTDSAPGHAFCLGSCLSQPTSQGLRLKGHSGKGVPRLCSPAPWLALPVLTVVAPTELYAQPLLCPFILYTPTEQKRGASGFLHISLPEQHVLGLDWPYPTTCRAAPLIRLRCRRKTCSERRQNQPSTSWESRVQSGRHCKQPSSSEDV